jgi:hypothetical protein
MVAREEGDARGDENRDGGIWKITFDAVKSVNTAGWATPHPVRSCDSCDFAILFAQQKKLQT